MSEVDGMADTDIITPDNCTKTTEAPMFYTADTSVKTDTNTKEEVEKTGDGNITMDNSQITVNSCTPETVENIAGEVGNIVDDMVDEFKKRRKGWTKEKSIARSIRRKEKLTKRQGKIERKFECRDNYIYNKNMKGRRQERRREEACFKSAKKKETFALDLAADLKVRRAEPDKPDIISHCHERRGREVAEEVVEEMCENSDQSGHTLRRSWLPDAVLSTHWQHSLTSPTGATNFNCDGGANFALMETENLERSLLEDVVYHKHDATMRNPKVYANPTDPSQDFPSFNPKVSEGYEAMQQEKLNREVHKAVAPTINMMYKLAEHLQLEADSEEADMFNTALEAMGAVNYFNKRLAVKIEAKKFGDPVLSQYMVESWDTQHGSLWGEQPMQAVRTAKRALGKARPRHLAIHRQPFCVDITKDRDPRDKKGNPYTPKGTQGVRQEEQAKVKHSGKKQQEPAKVAESEATEDEPVKVSESEPLEQQEKVTESEPKEEEEEKLSQSELEEHEEKLSQSESDQEEEKHSNV